MIRTAAFLATVLVLATVVQSADKPPKDASALEKLLLGKWYGPPCGGDWTFAADGTFQAEHYTPGNNRLTGAWEIRWDALPPTLIRHCATSDDPDHVDKTWEVKLVELNDKAMALQFPKQESASRYTRTAD